MIDAAPTPDPDAPAAFTVLAPARTHASETARRVVSTLPSSYRLQPDSRLQRSGGQHRDSGDYLRRSVVVIDGAGDWPARLSDAAIAGAGGIVLVEPQPADAAKLLGNLAKTASVVVVDSPWSSNPIVGAAAREFSAAAVPGSRLECRVAARPGAHMLTALLHQLGLVGELVGPVASLQILTWSDHGYFLVGTVDRIKVDLSLVTSTAIPESATTRLLTSDGSVHLDIPSGETAQPAQLITVGPHGEWRAPTIYESGHRATWRRLRRLLDATDPGSRHSAIQSLHDDMTVLGAATADHHQQPTDH